MQSESLCGVEDRFYDAYKMLQFSLSISNSLFLPLPFLVIFPFLSRTNTNGIVILLI